MQIIVNGEPQELDHPMTVIGFLEQSGIPVLKIAVERNLEIVPKSLYGTTELQDGDRLEIVQFVGGG